MGSLFWGGRPQRSADGPCALRMLHHAAWGCELRSALVFPHAFPWFGEPRHWEGYLRDLAEPLAAVDEPPRLAR